ncbi:MAG: 4-hydroxythreonine-4-phosphate dehydrogenase PdxA, partial [Hoeflea sp.]|nr:4-hydroxythreonine-4-phosphate dehydrogenase PdxA [Hoeflea sp.]
MNGHRRALALTMGDSAGIGPDLALAAWTHRGQLELPAFLMIADPAMLAERAQLLGLDVPLVEATAESAVAKFDRALPVLPVELARPAVPRHPDSGNAEAIIEAIRVAVELTTAARTRAVVTNPIAKSVLYASGFGFPGHTEYLAHLASENAGHAVTPVMLLSGPSLRVAPVTIHIPLRQVPDALTTGAIVETTRIVAHDLGRRFGLTRPRIAISGLNPHAGE